MWMWIVLLISLFIFIRLTLIERHQNRRYEEILTAIDNTTNSDELENITNQMLLDYKNKKAFELLLDVTKWKYSDFYK